MAALMSILLSIKVSGLERDELKCTESLFLNSCVHLLFLDDMFRLGVLVFSSGNTWKIGGLH